MTSRKSDAARIEARIDALKSVPWIGSARGWWPNFVFHFTDIRNIVSILTDGKLLARGRCDIKTDIASSDVINNTSTEHKNFVRLYLRPRTPTQFHNEGIRPTGGLTGLSAHCPIPIFLLFDAKDLLTRESTLFSNGNLAASPETGRDAEFFESLPFEKIYHDDYLPESEKRSIVFHRHAEVLVPHELDLDPLKYIICRSEAEAQTLRNLLPEEVRTQFAERITEARRANLFFRRWTFVETASLEATRVIINFNPSTSSPGPFSARLAIRNLRDAAIYAWVDPAFQANISQTITIPQLVVPTPYEATLTLGDAIAYSGRFDPNPMF